MPNFLFQYLKSYGDNFANVTPNRFIFRSAQPSREELRKYRDIYNIRRVLNLREDLPKQYFDDAATLNILFYNIPMKDDGEPKLGDIDLGLAIIKDSYINQIGILVCCKGGRHRTGLMIACYRYRMGWSKKEAWKEAEKYGWYDFNGHKPIKEFFFKEFK